MASLSLPPPGRPGHRDGDRAIWSCCTGWDGPLWALGPSQWIAPARRVCVRSLSHCSRKPSPSRSAAWLQRWSKVWGACVEGSMAPPMAQLGHSHLGLPPSPASVNPRPGSEEVAQRLFFLLPSRQASPLLGILGGILAWRYILTDFYNIQYGNADGRSVRSILRAILTRYKIPLILVTAKVGFFQRLPKAEEATG